MRVTLDELLRFERGDMDGAELARIRAELDRDPEARRELAWIHGLRLASRVDGEVCAEGLPATDDEIAALAMGELGAAEAAEVRGRLGGTPDGYGRLEAALAEVAALRHEDGRSAAPKSAGARLEAKLRLRLVLTLAAAATFIGFLAWIAPKPVRQDTRSIADLARIEALPVPTLRDGGLAPSLAAYGAGEYERAAEGLAAVVENDPGSAIGWLYLGSARLHLGDMGEAVPALENAVESGEGTSLGREARWVLAQAHIALDEPVAAAAVLLEVGVEGDEERRREAAALAEAIRARTGP